MKKQWGNVLIALSLLAFLWLVFLTGKLFGLFASCGVVPRSAIDIGRLLCGPLVHVDFAHIAANSVPLYVLSLLTLMRSRWSFVFTTLGGALLGGLGVWVFARHGNHMGASLLVFAYFGFLIAGAFATRTLWSVLLGVATFVLYGGIMYGVLPSEEGVSWEGHLFGFLGGVIIAFLITKLKHE